MCSFCIDLSPFWLKQRRISISIVVLAKSIMRLHKLPGRKAKKRGVQKASKERGARRKVIQVGKAVLDIILQLIRLDAMPKFPLENASDCLILALFMLELFKSGCPCDVTCLLFLAARHMRTPRLVQELLKRALKQKLRSVARAAIFMESELSKKPFSAQKTGAPFWPGFSSLHNSAVIMAHWVDADNQCKLFAAVSIMCDLAFSSKGHNGASILKAMDAIQKLPHAKGYSYDIVRLWLSALKTCTQLMPKKVTALKSLRKLQDDTDDAENMASRMAPHVTIVWQLLERVNAWEQLPAVGGGSKSFLCCEISSFLGHIKYVPSQKESHSDDFTVEQYAQGCNLTMLHNLGKWLAAPTTSSQVSEVLKKCRSEAAELELYFPQAKRVKHSSMAAKKFAEALPSALKI